LEKFYEEIFLVSDELDTIFLGIFKAVLRSCSSREQEDIFILTSENKWFPKRSHCCKLWHYEPDLMKLV